MKLYLTGTTNYKTFEEARNIFNNITDKAALCLYRDRSASIDYLTDHPYTGKDQPEYNSRSVVAWSFWHDGE